MGFIQSLFNRFSGPRFDRITLGPNGQPVDCEHFAVSDLADRWLAVMGDLLHRRGPSYWGPISELLPGYQLKFQATNDGSFIAFIYLGDRPVATTLFIGPNCVHAPRLKHSFIRSAQSHPYAQMLRGTFEQVRTIGEPPVLITALWVGPEDNMDTDPSFVAAMQIVTHLAGATLQMRKAA